MIENLVNNRENTIGEVTQKTSHKAPQNPEIIQGGEKKIATTLDALATQGAAIMKKSSITGLGTYQEPYIIDISKGVGKKNNLHILQHNFNKDGSFYNSFYTIIDDDHPKFVNNGGVVPLSKVAYCEYSNELRQMKNEYSKWVENIKFKYEFKRKESISFVEEFPTFEKYLTSEKLKLETIISGQIDELSKLEPLDCDYYFWRGVTINPDLVQGVDNDQLTKFANEIRNSKKGDILTPDCSPIFAGPDIYTAAQYTNDGTFMRIKVPKGARIGGTSQEVAFPSLAEFKVLANNEFNGLRIIDLEYILPEYK